jgi:hypothetical protein
VADLLSVNIANEHIVGWSDRGASVVGLRSTNFLNVGMGGTSAGVTDTSGRVDSPSPPAETWHQSMRFYRQAQLSEDLFDSLRSLWLAVENLLDDLHPQGAGQSEGRWLRAALAAAETLVDLRRYLPPSSRPPCEDAYAYFYDDLRGSIFHAKGSRGPRLPHEVATMRDLAERQSRLTRLYLDLLSEMCGVRRPGGVLTNAGFDMLTAAFGTDTEVHLIGDGATEGEVSIEAALREPATGTPGFRDGSIETPGLKVVSGVFDGAALSGVERVAAVVLAVRGEPLIRQTPDAPLRLHGVARFESYFGLRLRNTDTPRSFVGV